ncbi:LacI family transcriptional regulator [Lewinella marina]|uniref:LacI family transcriptional regulator n=1 Tax=Neolewinella marina TaxID=438751 RepID=A0A2G0CIX0_9BACT|nr:LacI family DNA-binding transcriptional regulator [Neolewinella marina]NJB84914.1 LacI family transcriptional regulator [Neolewinella marina]PHK99933.1 LacI family transcriptional regulator [Neolewinella marina]
MRKKAVTIYDIAERLKLSPSTVSRGLRNDPRINKETRRLIAETAQMLNYHPNRVAAGLRGGSTRTIGVIVPRIGRNFFAKAISGIEDVARARGFQVIITQSNEKLTTEMENVAALTAARVDGIIASVTMETVDARHFANLQKQQFPLVFFDRVAGDFPAHRVVLNDKDSAKEAVNHLIQGGARRIAHLSGPQSLNVYVNRYAGYRAALEEAGREVSEDYVDLDCMEVEQGYDAAKRLFALPEPPDAIFSASDYAALGVIRYCREKGISIPESLAVVSFANEIFTSLITPALSSVEQNSEQMGAAAAELLFKQIDSRDKPVPIGEVVIPGELRVRASSQRDGN